MMKARILFLICIHLVTVHELSAQVYGCTDPLAINYDNTATNNNGSCVYTQASVAALSSVSLDPSISETSGLILWNEKLLTHNDNSDTVLYSLDTLSGNILQQYYLPGVVNYDWEEIASDSEFIYIGDFGNNVNGNRTDLNILRIEKSSLLNNTPVIDTISFSYSDQFDFTPTGANNTDFDCEAFIVSQDSIFLFTKQWVSNKTALYSLPKNPGNHVAEFRSLLDVQGMVTGATYLESKRMIAFCAYTNLLQPFLYLLYDFQGTDFFGGNKRRLSLSLPFHQVEGIATGDGLKYYCSNEAFSQPPVINTPQKLHTIDLSAYLGNYMNELILTSKERAVNSLTISPNPFSGSFTISGLGEMRNAEYMITDQYGKLISFGKLPATRTEFDLSTIISGIYFFSIRQDGSPSLFYKLIRQ